MKLRKITETDLQGVGVVGMADSPNLSARQMQEKVEEVVRAVVIPVINENIDYTATKQDLADAVYNAGAGDMQASAYDSNLDGIVNRADNGIFTYVHTKSGTVHNLAGSGENIKFIAAADWNEGDSLTINGKVTHCLNNLFERVEGEVLFKQYAYVTATMRALTDYNRCFFKQGGAGMNFKIVGGTTQPASPKENTIWVNTDVAIGEYQFSSAEPTARADGTDLQTGDVWIRIGTSSNAEFNAVKKNSIYIYPQSCLQWDGTQFVSKEMKVYKNGEWTDTLVYLLLNGVAGEDTGGVSVLTPASTPSRGNYGCNLSSSGLKNAANGENQLNSTGTIEKFNATGMSTLYVEYTVSGVSKEYWFAFGLSANRNVYWSNYNSFSSQPWAAYNSYHKKAAGTYVDAIDISNLNGKHYFNACLLISGDYATCTLNITKIWMV